MRLKMLTNQDIVNIIEKHKSFKQSIAEIAMFKSFALTDEAKELLEKRKQEYEQWLKEEIK